MKHGFLALFSVAALIACGGPDRPATEDEPGAPIATRPDPEVVETTDLPPVAELPMVVEPSLPEDTERQGVTPSPGTGDAGAPAPAPTPAPASPAAAPAPSAPAGTNANDILARAERAYAQVRSMEADFVQEVRIPLLESTQHSRGKMFHRTPDRFRMQFSDPVGDLIVVDGRDAWMYYPSTDPIQVIRSPMSAGGQQIDLHREFLSDATRRYDATLTGTETVGGRTTHALTLVPRGSSPYTRVRIWVDAQDSLVRRFEIHEQNESVRRLDLSNLRPNVTLSDDLFRFTPPPGTQVFTP